MTVDSRAVLSRLDPFALKVQPYGPYPASQAAGAEMDAARERLAGLLNVDTDELHFGPSTSQNTYVLAQAFAGVLEEGDAIVVTEQDHEANSGVWRRLAERGIELREWRVDSDSGALDPEALAGLLDEKVALVCFPHCSNIVGEVNPVAGICRMAHGVDAVICVDGVSYAPHGFPDVGQFRGQYTELPFGEIGILSPELPPISVRCGNPNGRASGWFCR